MPKFIFDARLNSSFVVDAPDEVSAEKWLLAALDCASIEIGSLPNGGVIFGSISVAGELACTDDVDNCSTENAE